MDTSARRRAEYSGDASLYRVPPLAVAFPRSLDEVAAILEVCRETGVPLTARGGGTSVAGNAVGPGLVIDLSRHLGGVETIDPDARVARVLPGTVLDDLQRAAAPHGLRFGPDPSSHGRCTLGGMIGNNACGSHALAYGRTSDNVVELDVLTGLGERFTAGRDFSGSGGSGGDGGSARVRSALRRVVYEHLATIRTEFGRFGRQGSGFALEQLLPEQGFDLARALTGTEGTCAVVLGATVRLVPTPPTAVLVVLGYPDLAHAADAVPAVLPHRPVMLEGMDGRIVDTVRSRRGPAAVPPLPPGGGWLLAELAGESPGEVAAAAAALLRDAEPLGSALITDPRRAAAVLRVREDGAGLAGRAPSGAPAWAGWEDAAVPPGRLGGYLREFDALMADHRLTGTPYGHFGDGCLHVRIDFPLGPGGPSGPLGPGGGRPPEIAVFRGFLLEAARLVASYGGSMSGEHGDGRARGELLPYMYSPAALDALGAVKRVFDPGGLLNPGVIVDPLPVDADLRAASVRPPRADLALSYPEDGGDLTAAVHRCTGIGRCRADGTATGAVMCPSYLATRDEKDSTRGRARVLQEAASGAFGPAGWRAAEVREVLDLCLSCKGCAADCPTGVDMAAYKAEVLHQTYRRRLRPAAHYSLGGLPTWARLAALAPRTVNAALATAPLGALVKRLGGIDARRPLPAFATRTFRSWFTARSAEGRSATGRATGRAADRAADRAAAERPAVVLFVDTFTDHFAPETGIAAVRVLEHAGYRVIIPDRPVCCGLTFISTGRLDAARRRLRRTLGTLLRTATAASTTPGSGFGAMSGAADARAGRAGGGAPAGVPSGPLVPIVGLEPSCTAALRSDSRDLLGPADPAATAVACATRTLAEVLTATPGWVAPDLSGLRALAQPHCHHHAVLGWDTDAALLGRAGAEVRAVGGCCGLAGNFGVERGHYEVSVAVAETVLLPAVREADDQVIMLADGFSCRTQLEQLAGRHGVHLAEVLAGRLPHDG